MTDSVHQAAYSALLLTDPDTKIQAVAAMLHQWDENALSSEPGDNDPHPILYPGIPEKPQLVDSCYVQLKKVSTPEGHAALLHTLLHSTFNAINIILDTLYRFRSMPREFHGVWLRIASEKAGYFQSLRTRLQELHFDYADFPAHNNLWEVAIKSAHDPLIRMALFSRLQEARNLDQIPVAIHKLKSRDDHQSVVILEKILHGHIGHIAVGDRWFKKLCHQHNQRIESTYKMLLIAFDMPRPKPPLYEEARLIAGFSPDELRMLGILSWSERSCRPDPGSVRKTGSVI